MANPFSLKNFNDFKHYFSAKIEQFLSNRNDDPDIHFKFYPLKPVALNNWCHLWGFFSFYEFFAFLLFQIICSVNSIQELLYYFSWHQ